VSGRLLSPEEAGRGVLCFGEREVRGDARAASRFTSARVSRPWFHAWLCLGRGSLRARGCCCRRCSVCLEATAPLRMAALSVALSLIVRFLQSPLCHVRARVDARALSRLRGSGCCLA